MTESTFNYQTPFLNDLNIKRFPLDPDNPNVVVNLSIDLVKGLDLDEEHTAQIGVKVCLNTEEDESSNIPFILEMVMMANFKWNKETDEEQLKIFLTQNAPTLLISYARPLIQSITASTQYPGFDLPFINLADI